MFGNKRTNGALTKMEIFWKEFKNRTFLLMIHIKELVMLFCFLSNVVIRKLLWEFILILAELHNNLKVKGFKNIGGVVNLS